MTSTNPSDLTISYFDGPAPITLASASATFGFCPNRHALSEPPSTRDNARAPWYMVGTFSASPTSTNDEAQVRH